jgi:cellobiose phosphorylase
MAALAEQLVRPEERLILLFTPPLDKTPRDPGYIKGYVPGIRENGGQYTHAALWAIWAMAELGEGDRAAAWLKMINPIYHAQDAPSAARYKVEPYVVAADVYGVTPHVGRGGWTWYTGSAAWMYRLGLEAILGVRREGAALRFSPCLPSEWPGFSLIYRFGQTAYTIEVEKAEHKSSGAITITVDGHTLAEPILPLEDDRKPHHVKVHLS